MSAPTNRARLRMLAIRLEAAAATADDLANDDEQLAPYLRKLAGTLTGSATVVRQRLDEVTP
jgi:hypothetical protein